MKKKILYATQNPGKLSEVRRVLSFLPIEVLSPADLGIALDVPEEGQSFEENAILKAQAFSPISSIPLITDDTGLEIDALGGEPGVRTRRWKGYRMSDQEIIDHALERLERVPWEARGAQFRTVIALSAPPGAPSSPELFQGTLRGKILEKPLPQFAIEGFPFWGLFWVEEISKVLGEAQDVPGFLTHRGRAILSALPRIKEIFNL